MIPNLTQPRMVSLEEVAALFGKAQSTIKTLVQHGKFPVPPRTKGKGTALTWSSMDLLKYLNDPKTEREWAAKRGTRSAGAK